MLKVKHRRKKRWSGAAVKAFKRERVLRERGGKELGGKWWQIASAMYRLESGGESGGSLTRISASICM
jgi:hypothetical protein